MKQTYPLLTHLPAILWAGIVAFLSLTSGKNLPKIDWDLFAPDKAAHLSVYALLTFLALAGIFNYKKRGVSTHSYTLYIYASLGAISYGVLMEYLQYYLTPDRHFEFDDMVANTIGACLGCVVSFVFFK